MSLFARASWRVLVAVSAAVVLAAAIVVFIQPLGRRVFGHLDEEWRSVVYQVCFVIDPMGWTAGDWLAMA